MNYEDKIGDFGATFQHGKGRKTYGFVPRVGPSIGSRIYLTAFVFLKGDRWGEVTEARRIWLA
jgi:hypothetical protein